MNVFPGVVADGVVSWTSFENVWPRSREMATWIFPFGWRPPPQNALNGSVVMYARTGFVPRSPVSKSTFGSVLFVQLGGISSVPTVVHSYPWTWLFEIGDPLRIV